jgi:membrane protease YdiL (CAAX protease family)
MRESSRSKAILVAGTVKAWHAVFIVVAGWAVAQVAAGKLGAAFDPSVREVSKALISTAIADTIYLAFVLAIPEFRKTLPMLFRRPIEPVSPQSVAWAVAALFFWGFGLFRLAFLLPMLAHDPGAFDHYYFRESMPSLDFPTVATFIFMGSVCAPFGEEIMFRGFVLSLLVAKRGIWFGVIASSLVFGVLHQQTALHASVAGLIFALVYLRYDSLWPGIALHALYNFAAPLWALGALVSLKPRAEATDLSHWVLEIALSVLFFPAAWQFWCRFRPRGA